MKWGYKEHLLGNVRQRQIRQHRVFRGQSNQVDGRCGGEAKVVVGQHHCLGWTGGARSIDKVAGDSGSSRQRHQLRFWGFLSLGKEGSPGQGLAGKSGTS